jgi:hypothetical protein
VIHLALFDIEAGRADEFRAWYESEHIPAMLERPGWRRMCGYRCTDGAPLLSLYEVEPDIPLTPRLSEAPFRFSGTFAARGLRNYTARTWREIHAAGTAAWAAPWVNAITVDIEPPYADEFSDWYSNVHVPEILACPGWLAGRRFECVDGEPRFLAIYDLEDPVTPFTSPQWREAVGWGNHAKHIRGFFGFRVYELTFDSDRDS